MISLAKELSDFQQLWRNRPFPRMQNSMVHGAKIEVQRAKKCPLYAIVESFRVKETREVDHGM